jgi:NAD(P)-dependent dehydrogenase (short-subunit alcohol dehydrogenase family)
MINPMNLTGRTIFVTGASSGLGRDAAILLSELGARVILVARNEERLNETRSRLAAGEHVVAPFDITRHEQTLEWMAELARVNGPIHGLVHSAGIGLLKALRFLEVNEMQELVNVNLLSAMVLAKAFRQKSVRARPWASMVFLSSVSGLAGFSGLTAYGATKAGVAGLTRGLAEELARESIRVNCVAPSWVSTEMTDASHSFLSLEQMEAIQQQSMIGPGTPRDVSHAIAFLLSDAARWITGLTLPVDGGHISR